jgi:preprotein translocase subunit SecB
MTDKKHQTLPQQVVDIQRTYVKNLSFESPSSPDIFKQQFAPEIKIDLDVTNKALGDDLFEVVLSVTASAAKENAVVFLAEVEQAGIFQIKGFAEDQLDHILSAFCPTILFPYAREVISDMVVRGSFPQLNLAPVNFEAIYVQQKQAKAKEAATGEKTKH